MLINEMKKLSTKYYQPQERSVIKSLESIDKGSMHVVKHHDDLFSWKKNTTITSKYIGGGDLILFVGLETGLHI